VQCRTVVEDGEKDVAIIESDIETTRAHLKHLTAAREELQKNINLHGSILRSPRKLNQDVLSEIFSLSCRMDAPVDTQGQHSLDVHRVQWRLGQTCSSWREIANHKMPTLWTSLKILLKITGSSFRAVYLLEQHLRRSRGQELDVCIYLSSDYDPLSQWHQVIAHLFVSCDRWRSLHIGLCRNAFESRAMGWGILSNNLPKLRRLSRYLHGDNIARDYNPDGALWQAFKTAPLHSLTLTGLVFPRDARFSSINIYNYHYADVVYPIMPFDLRAMTCLEHCRIDAVVGRHTETTVPGEEIIYCLPKLHTFEVHSIIPSKFVNTSNTAQRSEAENTLDRLNIPSLKSLTLSGTMYSEKSIVNMIQRSKCSLDKLSFSADLRSSNYCQILELTPGLQSLSLPYPLSSDSDSASLHDLLARLTLENGRGLCPALQHLTMQIFGQETTVETIQAIFDSEPALSDMLESRTHPRGVLHTFVFQTGPEMSEAIRNHLVKFPRLKMLENCGLKVQFLY
jgi:hypothetical protein